MRASSESSDMARSSQAWACPVHLGNGDGIHLRFFEREPFGAVYAMGFGQQDVRRLTERDERSQAAFHPSLSQVAPTLLSLQVKPQDVALEAPDAGDIVVGGSRVAQPGRRQGAARRGPR